MKKRFDLNSHKAILVRILRDIYADNDLRTLLGFKGGTAAMLFYGLDRGSVDLDFNLIDSAKEEVVMSKLPLILEKYGKVIEAIPKRHTLFFLLNYGTGEKKVKVEISRRESKSEFVLMNYLGVNMLVMRPEDTLANKLVALLTRRAFASRDMYDLNFFLKKDWTINEEVVKEQTGLALEEALKKALEIVENVPPRRVLHGLGELVGDDQKDSTKATLVPELVFNLKLYLSNLED